MFNAPGTIENTSTDNHRIKRSFLIAAGFTALLWLIRIFESISGISLSEYGIYPGSMSGLPGIVLAPLIHGSFSHLFANSAPLIILGTALLYGYPRSAGIVIPVVYIGTGLCVWLFGRPAWHIGASGLVFGLMLFVFTIGAIRWDKKAIALSMLVFFLYGGIIVGVVPDKPNISFESHLCGAILGLVLAVLLRNTDPRPPEKRYSWDDEEDYDPEQES
jgi:membrane associated rhomboid family serine protease